MLQLDQIRQALADADGFTLAKVSERAGLSRAVARRVLGRALERGLVTKFCVSSRTRYFFA
jgi:DNA-binding transcriptional regulator LsrR (DeoR family)